MRQRFGVRVVGAHPRRRHLHLVSPHRWILLRRELGETEFRGPDAVPRPRRDAWWRAPDADAGACLAQGRTLVVLLDADVLDSECRRSEKLETFATFKGRDDRADGQFRQRHRPARSRRHASGPPQEHVLDRGDARRSRDRSAVPRMSSQRSPRASCKVRVRIDQPGHHLHGDGRDHRCRRRRHSSRRRRAQREARVALAAENAAQAELIETQDHAQIDLAASLAFDSLQRSPSLRGRTRDARGPRAVALPDRGGALTVGERLRISHSPPTGQASWRPARTAGKSRCMVSRVPRRGRYAAVRSGGSSHRLREGRSRVDRDRPRCRRLHHPARRHHERRAACGVRGGR